MADGEHVAREDIFTVQTITSFPSQLISKTVSSLVFCCGLDIVEQEKRSCLSPSGTLLLFCSNGSRNWNHLASTQSCRFQCNLPTMFSCFNRYISIIFNSSQGRFNIKMKDCYILSVLPGFIRLILAAVSIDCCRLEVAYWENHRLAHPEKSESEACTHWTHVDCLCHLAYEVFYPPDEAGQRAVGRDGERSQWGSLGSRIPLASLNSIICVSCDIHVVWLERSNENELSDCVQEPV